jgi:hypothetical protein
MWKNVNRRVRVVALAALLAATASILSMQSPAFAAASDEGVTETLTTAQQAILAAAGYGGDVHRDTVMERGKDWYSRNVPYNQSATAWDMNNGKKYRTDCSGFISMAWKLNSSLTTSTLDTVSHVINWNDLLRGDALLLQGDHVQLFDKWVDANAKADFWIYEEGSTASDMNHRQIHVVTERNDGYKPYRYNHIIR